MRAVALVTTARHVATVRVVTADDFDSVSLDVRVGSREVPAVMWSGSAGTAPLVLIGHGGSGHKTADHQRSLARRLVGEGFAVVAIDGPVHGDRAVVATPAEHQRVMVDLGVERVTAEMVEDWCAAAEAAVRTGRADPDRLGYVGMSMGARFGLPLVAALGERIGAAVIGKFGLEQQGDLLPELHLHDILRGWATQVVAPVLWHVQWDDELFPRAGALRMFDALAAADKQLVAFPGRHGVTAPAAVDAWVAHLKRHLLD